MAPARWVALGVVSIVLLLTIASEPSQSAGTRTVVVNLKSGENFGCSDERPYVAFFFPVSFDAPDLQARIWYKGQVVYSSVHARDTWPIAEWFEMAKIAVDTLPATIQLEIREAEPGPSEQEPTWIRCDLTPGDQELLEAVIPASGEVVVDSRGDGSNAARLLAVAASADSPHPDLLSPFVNRAPNCLHLHWVPRANEPATWNGLKLDSRTTIEAGTGTSSFDWCGLAERTTYHAQFVRSWGHWKVVGPRESWSTVNGPPPPPTLGLEGGLDEINVSWSIDAPDAARVNLQCAQASGFQAGAFEACGEGGPHGTLAIARPAGRTYVRVVGFDHDGASNSSGGEAIVSVRPAPPAPIVHSPTLSRGNVTFSWDPPTTAGVLDHHLHLVDASSAQQLATMVIPADRTSVTYDPLIPGDYILTAIARNANLLESVPTLLTFAHSPPNAPPIVIIETMPARPRPGELVVVAPTAVDPDGDKVSLLVIWEGEPPTDLFSRTFSDVGEFVGTVLARDSLGGTSNVSFRVRVVENGRPNATVTLREPTIILGERAIARIDAEDPDGDVISLAIDWGDGTALRAANRTPSHVFQEPGERSVRVKAFDNFGGEVWAEATMHVLAERPPDTAGAPADGARPVDVIAAEAAPPNEGPEGELPEPTDRRQVPVASVLLAILLGTILQARWPRRR